MNSPINKDPQDIPEVDNINLRELFDVALKSKNLSFDDFLYRYLQFSMPFHLQIITSLSLYYR